MTINEIIDIIRDILILALGAGIGAMWGIIKPEELPDKYGLLYWDGKQIRPVVAPKAFDNTGRADMRIMASILRREQFPEKIFNYRGTPSTIQPKTINGIPEREYYNNLKPET